MNRKLKQSILIAFDLLAIILSSILAYAFLNIYVSLSSLDFWLAVIFSGIIYLVLANRFHLYSKINRYTSIRETLLHMISITISFFISMLLIIPFAKSISMRFMLLAYIFSMAIIPGSRVVWRIIVEHYHKRQELVNGDQQTKKVRTIIVGAGSGGSLFIKSLQGNNLGIEIVGIVDDEESKQGMYVYDEPVLGYIAELPELVKKTFYRTNHDCHPFFKEKRIGTNH